MPATLLNRAKPPPKPFHRDLKAENVLMLAGGTWVLCDFGSATSRAKVYAGVEEIAAEEDVIRKHTTPAYRAPEVGLVRRRCKPRGVHAASAPCRSATHVAGICRVLLCVGAPRCFPSADVGPRPAVQVGRYQG